MTVQAPVLIHDREICPTHHRDMEWDGYRWVCTVCILDGKFPSIRNTDEALKRYFSQGCRHAVTNYEFYNFWNSLTDDEKTYYRTNPLD